MKKFDVKKYNKELLKKYPFLLPRNVWTGLEIPDYDYTYTLADDIPIGWRAAFGDLLIEEINQDLLKNNFVDEYRIMQIKEKYGGLRWYSGGLPRDSKISNIVHKYEMISENICIACGKPDVPMIPRGWISPYCSDCCNKFNRCSKEEYDELTADPDDYMIPDSYTVRHFSVDGDWDEIIDISNIANMIRQRWDDGTILKRRELLKNLYPTVR